MSGNTYTDRKRRVSIGSQEFIILESQWDLVQNYIEHAEAQYTQDNTEKALEFCKKALSLLPDYLPAVKLQRRIAQSQAAAAANESEEDDESSSALDETAESSVSSVELDKTIYHQSLPNKLYPVVSTPAPKNRRVTRSSSQPRKIQWNPEALPTVKGILKQTPIDNLTQNGAKKAGKHFSDDSDEEEGRRTTRKSRQARREREEESTSGSTGKTTSNWEKIKKCFTKANRGELNPKDFYVQVGELLWNEGDKVYACAFSKCKYQSPNRSPCINHILDKHLPKDFAPFVCQSCKTGKRTVDDLLAHGFLEHPFCHSMISLAVAVKKHS